MKKILVGTILTFTISILAFSQASDSQIERQSERELIALSRDFVKTSIATITVEEGGIRMTPFGPMPSLEVKEQRDAAGMKEMKVEIDGDHAIVKGHVVFGRQAPQNKTGNSSASVTIHFHKQKEQWKLVKGCFGECDPLPPPNF